MKTRAATDYAALWARIRSLTEGEEDPVALMATLACELYHGVERFDWVGFYRVTEPGVLRIGPYQGGHGCLVIPFDRGVCGAAAREERPQIVPDVDAFPGHIACSANTRSEIVLPVFDSDGALIAVLDIDSDAPDAFDEADRDALEAILAEVFAPPRAEPEGLARLIQEDDVLFGPVLLGVHLLLAATAWPIEWALYSPGETLPAEIAASFFIAITMMIPVLLIVRAYYHRKVSPLPTALYMLAHAGLIIVGYAGIFGMLEYGPSGGLEADDDAWTSCRPSLATDFYISAITFSTVGYGDCVPYGWARLFAGIEGLLSYVFVGIVIGLMTGIAPGQGGDGPPR